MTKRRTIILSTLLLLAAAAFGFYYVIHPHEPAYEGRTVRSWLVWYYTHGGEDDIKVYEKAEAALRHLDTNAIPPLLELLQAETNSVFRFKFRALCDKIDFLSGPLLADEESRLAKRGLRMLGDAVTNALPELIRMCRQTNSTRLQGDVYGFLFTAPSTPESTALFHEALTNSDDVIRTLAYDYLTRTNQPERLQLLIEALKDTSLRVQQFAEYRLKPMRRAAKPAVPFLVPLAGVISNGFRADAYSYNPAAAALRDIDPETAAKVLPPPFDWSPPPVSRRNVPNPRE